ncbi:MAG: xanthine dehydrogenase family protein molybdopterin-binding subunit [Actinomycetota bacterium]
MGTSIFGSAVRRTEDPRFLRGEGRYTENIPVEGSLRAVFVRAQVAHARVLGIDVAEASAMPGVVGVYVAADLDLTPIPPSGSVADPLAFRMPVLADDVVRYVGQPVALVVADTLAHAQDAAEVVIPDLDPLPAAVDLEAAAAPGAPALFPEVGTNVAEEISERWDEDVLAGAEVVVRGRFVNQRLAPAPLETNAAAFLPEGDGWTMYVSTQVPFDVRDDVAETLGVKREALRVIAPDVGGGFGTKLQVYPEYHALAAVARRLGRAVRWSESRSESMTALVHGRAQVQTVELGAMRDGTLVGMRADILADMGAFPLATYLVPTTRRMLSGVYRIPRIASRGRAVVTPTTPIAAYRGAGRPEAAALVERAMDLLAADLGMDPVALRRRNLIPADAFPYETAVGETYDVGDYERALDRALDLAGVAARRRALGARRARGDTLALGIGIAVYVEITGFSPEFGSVEVHEDGGATVLTGTSPHGQGHETAFAQLASGLLGIPFERVRVVHSDTGVVPRGQGTYGSRSLQIGGSAVWNASEDLLTRARTIAAHALEVHADDVVVGEGRLEVAGAPDRAITWSDLATIARDPARLPEGMEPGLRADTRFRQGDSTFPFGAHVSIVEVDLETGDARAIDHVAVDDCGRILNPMLVDGQVHGGLGQGIAQALYEEVRYDELGTPLTGTLATYPFPAASELPSWRVAHTETPTPLNPLGAKGIGESATVGSTPAVQNAVVDALAHLGVRHIDLPLTPERVLAAIRAARS